MRFILTLLFLTLALPVAGSPVTVTSSEHPGFTRLVLSFDSRPDWFAAPDENGQIIRFQSEEDLSFDLERAKPVASGPQFAIVASGKSLSINYNCNCRSELRNQGQDNIVFDIYEIGELGNVEAMDASPAQPMEIWSITEESFVAPPPDPRPGRIIRESDETFSPPEFDLSTILEIAAAPADTRIDFLPVSNEHGEAVAALGRELSRAAAQGLIEANPDPIPRIGQSSAPTADSVGKDRSNLSATTGLDREILAIRDRPPPTNLGATCLPDSEVDLATWGDVALLGDLGMLRGRAIAEDGALKPDGVLALARYYIALGFGAEARAYAELLPNGNNKALIQALGDIMDNVQTASPVFEGQIFCTGKVSLWALLSKPVERSRIPSSTDDILSTFSALPPHLRAHLGPTLAERLRFAGLEDEARIAVNAVARGGAESSESALVSARLGLSGTAHKAAQSQLESLSSGTDVTAAAALIELLDDAARRDLPPNPNWVEDAPSLVRATIGTEISERLNIAGLRGRIALGQFDLLRLALETEMPGVDDLTRKTLANEALAKAAKIASGDVFLKTEIGLSGMANVETMDRTDRYLLAKRLVDLDLPERANAYLPDTPNSDEEAISTALALSANGEATRAIELLKPNAEHEARKTLGLILKKYGRDREAIPVLQSAGLNEEALSAAMRIGDWEWIAERETELSETARVLLAPGPELSPGIPSNGDLIRSSMDLRSQVENLLSSMEGSPPFTN